MSFYRSREFVLAVLLIGLMVVASWLEPRFVTVRAQGLFASHFWELAMVAVPMFLIIMIGGIDLSVGSIVALCSVCLGLAYEQSISPFVAAALAVVGGGLLGFANGWTIVKLRVHPLIVTLATMAAYRGIAEGISLARPISGFPRAFQSLSGSTLAGIPIPMIVFAALVVGALAHARSGAAAGSVPLPN